MTCTTRRDRDLRRLTVPVFDIALARGIAGIDWCALNQMPVEVTLSGKFDSFWLVECRAVGGGNGADPRSARHRNEDVEPVHTIG